MVTMSRIGDVMRNKCVECRECTCADDFNQAYEDCLIDEVYSLRAKVNELKEESRHKSEIIERERVVQRKIHDVFRALETHVKMGWETCLGSFGERDSMALKEGG